MRQQKKNKFFTFIFSLMPGAAEMYMGFLKYGLSLMGLFFAGIFIPNALGLYDLPMICGILVWFYAFFHARNLATMNDIDFQAMQDEFVWESFANGRNLKISNPTLKKWGAMILIVVGIILLWNNFSSVIYQFVPEYLWDYVYPIMDKIPQVAVAIIIIVIGFKLIAGKKEEMNENGQ